MAEAAQTPVSACAPAPAPLSRVTTRYSPEQDRISLAGELPEGGHVLLWLTQRLMTRLVPVLCDWLQANDQPWQGAGVESVRGSAAADGLQTFAQQSARAQQAPQPPVRPSEDCAQALVTSMDVARGANGVNLVVHVPLAGGGGVFLPLHTQSLRQWLGVLADVWGQAGWPADVWPRWMHEASARGALQGESIH